MQNFGKIIFKIDQVLEEKNISLIAITNLSELI